MVRGAIVYDPLVLMSAGCVSPWGLYPEKFFCSKNRSYDLKIAHDELKIATDTISQWSIVDR